MQKRSRKGRKTSGRSRSGSGSRKTFPQYVGKVQMTREGFIFVMIDGQDDDVFVKANKTRHALQGDTVLVAVTRQKSGDVRRREGEVVEILERSTRPFVGYYHTVGAQAWVLMQSKTMPYDIQVDAEAAAAQGAQAGMKVAAVVDRWDRRDPGPFGHVVDVLGMPGENETEMHAILAEFNLPYRFSSEVENAADKISEEITDADLKGRKDFRDTFTFTIDPADAKDFDDALSFRPLENGNYEIGVHIADVSYYVKPGSPVDQEARERGTSVYLVDRTVPMLPEKLCNKLCSLRPHEDKLTFSAVFEMTPKAEIKSRWIGRTVINSDYRLDYDQAQQIIESAAPLRGSQPLQTSGDAGPLPSDDGPLPLTVPRVARSGEAAAASAAPADSELETAIISLHKLASILKENERNAGAIDFDRPEMKVEVDEKGKPLRVYQKVSKEANWLIEEFMLLANRTVAEFVATGGQMNGVAQKNAKTFVYRVHGEPNEIKLEALYTFAKGFGHRIPNNPQTRAHATAKALNQLLESAKGRPEFAAMENLALRAMAKACYSTDNIGHYGLAFKFYTHFTSPIRRYPDLMVHRLLSLYLGGAESRKKEKYEEECRHASERELVAADAERTSVKYKLVEFMMDKIGEEYDGHVSGVTEWGMYVEIEPTKIEGMVSVRDIRSDFFEFDEPRYRLVGKRSHRQFRLGDAVRIRVKNANLEQRLLDFELIEDPE
ncbi:MAG: RNB domain-containing ribonuclease [Bacteroidales bacterium]|nr:RNB domain-containing ribonuclease [Bacteroidales bacterium]